ncbi:hypothetical protein KFL_003560020 [Klebsormidium nitens]|uniref:WRC domain-containing protein n=1 Tax=Klebsormidium nitens TaxID=105231 RepID=A0A1Y1I915_KLENI|nr:hypothetical protein KFL_003560020 [Klebsormidium nitens]|eukprot:GAQ87475.1 hypothetical protein KFL_003560020 [Klebsormidium nitens]
MLAHKFREAVESEDVPSRRELRLQNVPCIDPPAVGLNTFPEARARKRVRANGSEGLPGRRLRKLSDMFEEPTTSGRPTERKDHADLGSAQGAHVVVFCKLEDGASVADRQQKAGCPAGEGSQEGSQCSRRAGSGWQCPFLAQPYRAMCLKHSQQKRLGVKKGGKGASLARTNCGTNSCSVEGRPAVGKESTNGNKQVTGMDSRRQQGRPRRRKFGSQTRERLSKRPVKRVEVPMQLVEGGPGVVVQLGKAREEGVGAEDWGTQVIDVEALEEVSAVSCKVGRIGGQQLGAAGQCVEVRKSARLAKRARPTARKLLGIAARNGDRDRCVKRRKVSGVKIEPALPQPASSVCKLQYGAEVVCISDSSSDCLPLPTISCVVGEWSAAELERSRLDGATWKRMRLHGSTFYANLLEAVGGAAAFQECEWGGILKHRGTGNKGEALLGIVPSRVGRGSHDHVQVAEDPFSWHSHAILADSWPNLPSTADLLGVARESNLRPGGRGHVHLVVTPIGTWVLQATEELVRSLYDGSTRNEAEAVLELRLQQIFDAHKCSVGYLPGVVPVDAPDFWMDGHEAAIRDALTKGDVEAQVRAYAKQLEKDADFVVGFVGHGAADACFPLCCKPASQRALREKPLLGKVAALL